MRSIVLALVATYSLALQATAQSRPFSSSDAADAAERLTGRRAHMNLAIRLIAGTRLEGTAITLQLARDDQASLMEEGLKAIAVFEEAPSGAVIVACLDGAKDLAVFGPTFATLSGSRGLAGIVTDGAVRGVSDLRRIGLPVFAAGGVPGSAGGHYRLAAVNVPVTCGGVEVAPGDVLVGDQDGVAVIPAETVDAARVMAQRLRDEKEALLPLIATLGSYTKAVAELRARRARTP